MAISDVKIDKLVKISKLYYEENMNQNEISKLMGISRPLVSRYLTEAKENGIVKIEIRSPIEERNALLNKAKVQFGLKGGIVVSNRESNVATDKLIASETLEGIKQCKNIAIGVGWGSIFGEIISLLKDMPIMFNDMDICPLIGNSNVFNRNYHSNEIVRTLCENLGGKPNYLHSPAFFESNAELLQFKMLPAYKNMLNTWKSMKVVFLSIGNYPSVPDFATAANFGDKLIKENAVGKLVGYYFDRNGRIIKPVIDRTMQIPLEILSKRKNVVGICKAGTSPKSLIGALNTGIFTHIICSESLIKEMLELPKIKKI